MSFFCYCYCYCFRFRLLFCFRFCFCTAKLLNCIHEALFGAVEDDDSEEQGDGEGSGAVEEASGREGADTKAAVFKCLEDGRQGIDIEVHLILGGGKAQGVDNWRSIHEQLDTETNEHVQVTVLRGQRGNDETPRHGVEADHDDENRSEEER